jgi:hypothetical protein
LADSGNGTLKSALLLNTFLAAMAIEGKLGALDIATVVKKFSCIVGDSGRIGTTLCVVPAGPAGSAAGPVAGLD